VVELISPSCFILLNPICDCSVKKSYWKNFNTLICVFFLDHPWLVSRDFQPSILYFHVLPCFVFFFLIKFVIFCFKLFLKIKPRDLVSLTVPFFFVFFFPPPDLTHLELVIPLESDIWPPRAPIASNNRSSQVPALVIPDTRPIYYEEFNIWPPCRYLDSRLIIV
jgi:hypothetical protein